MNQRRAEYRVDVFDAHHGFIKFDAKKNQDDAERIADVTAKSRKRWFRVVHRGQTIAEYDFRKKT